MAAYTPATSKNIWGFDPTSIGGCTLWLDGADKNTMFSDIEGTTPSTTGGNVARWNDKSISKVSAIINNNVNSYNTIYATSPPTLGADRNSGRSVLNFGVGLIRLTATTATTNIVTVTNSSFNLSAGQHLYVTAAVGGLGVGAAYYVYNPSGTPTTSFQLVSTPSSTTPVTLTTTTSQSIPVVISSAPLILPFGSRTVRIPINTTTSTLTVVYPPTATAPVNYMLPAVGQTVNFTSSGSITGINTTITYYITSVSGTVGTSLTFTVSTTPGGTNSSFTLGGTDSTAGVSIGRGTFVSGQQDCTMFVVARTLHTSSVNSTVFSYGNYVGYAVRAVNLGGDFSQIGNGTSSVTAFVGGAQSNLNITTGTFNNSIQSGWLNGIPYNSTNLFDLQRNGGNWQTGTAVASVGAFLPAYPMYGYIAEILYYNTALSNTDRQNIEGYLAHKWNLVPALPTSHPYYNNGITHSFVPPSLAHCSLWLDASDMSTLYTSEYGVLTTPAVNNGDLVGTWVDKSGFNSFAYATGAGINPQLNLNSINGRSTIRTSNGQFMSLALGTADRLPVDANAGTYFTVSRTVTTPADEQVIFVYGNLNSNPNRTRMRQVFYSSTNTLAFDTTQSNRVTDSTVLSNTVAMMSATQNSTTTSGWLNGNPFSGGTVATSETMQVGNGGTKIGTIGAGYEYTTDVRNNFFEGDLAEIIVFNLVLSTAQRQQVEGYLAWKWGIQASLPSTHPYKLANYFYTVTRPFSRSFAPTDISNCIMWYDGADLRSMFTDTAGTTAVTGNGSAVRLWRDKSGTGNNLTTVASANSPTLRTSTNPQKFDMVFDGGDYLSNTAIVNNSNTYTKFLVFYRNSTSVANYERLFSYGKTSGDQKADDPSGFHIQGNNSQTNYFLFKLNASTVNFNISTNTYYIMTIVASPLTMSLFLNGTAAGSVTLPNTDFSGTTFRLGTNFFALSNAAWGGFMNEVISYNRQLSTYEYQEVEGYLAWKWGLRNSLPITHPFYKFPTPSLTPFQPELQLYKDTFDPSDLSPTIWLDSSDTTTYASTNNRLTSWTSKGTQALTFAPPNIPYAIQILANTNIAVGPAGTTFTMSRTVCGIGTLSGITVTVGGTAVTNCTLVGGSNQLITGSSVTIFGLVTAATYSITLQSSTTTTGGTAATSFTLNLAPTGTGTISGVQAYVAGVPIPNCTFTGGSTTFTTGASITIANGADVVVQPGPLINSATRGSGFTKTYTDFTSGGTFRLTAGTNLAYNSTAITLTASTVALDGQSIVVSSVPRVTLSVNQQIVFAGSGTVIAGSPTNITAGTTYFIQNVSTLAASNTNFPTNYITLSLTSGGGAITGLTPNTSLSATATAGAYLFTFTTSIPHRIPNGAPITAVLDSHSATGSAAITGTRFGNIQSVPSETTFTFWLTSNLTNLIAGTSSNLLGSIQYGNNTVVSASLAGDGTTLTMTTALPHNLQTGCVIQPYFFGPSLPSQWAPYTAATVRSGSSTFTGTISGTTLTVSAGTPPGIGAVLTGTGVTANTYVRGILTYGTSYQVNVSSSVTGITITSTYTGPITFTGSISGTTLTYSSGTVPLLGMIISGSSIASGTYIVSGTSPTFTVSTTSTAGSTTITGSNYSVELTFPSTNWPILAPGLNNNGSSTVLSSTGNNITVNNVGGIGTVGSIIVFISAVGAVPAGAYYVASISESVITISSSRTLTPVLTPGTSSATVPLWSYNLSSTFRLCSFGTSPLNNLNNLNGSMVWVDNASRTILLSGFTGTQPSAGVMSMSQIQNPGLQYGGSGSFSNSFLWGAENITRIDDNSFTISLNNLSNDSINLSSNASQTYGGITYSGPMGNYGFTDFRFGGNGTGGFSFGNTTGNTITQAMISYPANGYLLDASGSNLTNAFSSLTTTVLMAVHSSTIPLRAGGISFASTLLSTAVTANNIGGRDTTSGGRDFALIPSGTSQGLQMMLSHNNSTASFRPPVTLDATSGYRIFSVVFNGTTSAVGDVAALTRSMAAFGFRFDAVNGTFAYNTNFFPTSFTTITSGTALAPTVMRLGGDTAIYGFGINTQAFGEMGVAELLVFNTPLTLEQRQLAEGYLSQKYSCQYILANGSTTVGTTSFIHPYRTNPTSISQSLDLTRPYAQGLATWFDAANSSTIGFSSGNFVNSWTSAGGTLGMVLTNTHTASTVPHPTYSADSSGRYRVKFTYTSFSITTASINATNDIRITSSTAPIVDQFIIFSSAVSVIPSGNARYIVNVSSAGGTKYDIKVSTTVRGTPITLSETASIIVSGTVHSGNSLLSTTSFTFSPQLSTRSSNNEFTNILVFSRDGLGGSSGYFINYVQGGNQRITIEDNRTCDYLIGTSQAVTYSSTTLVSNIPYILINYRRGSTGFTRLIGNGTITNVTSHFTNLALPINNATLSMGAYDSPFDVQIYQNVSGSIYEHMLFKYALTDQSIFQIEGYLAWKWGLQNSLPTTHSYYKLRP